MDKEKDGDTRLSYEGVEYLVDSRSAEMIKKSGNVTLDYQTGEGYGSGFTVNFGEPSSGCADGCSC
jgi:Fe-S cluster assembly iron-binding protein IscA